MNCRFEIALLTVLWAACGGVGDDNAKDALVVSTDTLASTYLGRLSVEAFDGDTNVAQRFDLDEYVVEISVGPSGSVLLDGLASCALRVADDLVTIPPQRCVEHKGNERMVAEIAGTLQADARRLKIDLDEIWTSYDTRDSGFLTWSSVTTFEGVAISDAMAPVMSTSDNGTCPSGQLYAAVDGFEGCHDTCNVGQCNAGQRCASGVCVHDDSQPVSGAETQSSGCETNADCRADQHCVLSTNDASPGLGTCEELMVCDDVWYDMDTYGAWASWRDCSDGREYRADCERGAGQDWVCECQINGVFVGSFETISGSYYGREDAFQDTVNTGCGWLMPGHSNY